MSNMNVLMHNAQAMFSNRQLGITNNNRAKSTEKLSSGYKINRAADDAAGLAISEKMRRMVRGLNQGAKNIQDGVSMMQVADGYLEEVTDMLHRMSELAIKSANGTNTDDDREAMDEEVQALKSEMKRIFKTADFNGIKIFDVPYRPNVDISTDVETVLTHSSTSLPPGVEMDANSLNNGYMSAGAYTARNGITYNTAAYLDFSNVDMSNLSSMNGTGFYTTCCTCNNHYVSVTFDSNSSASSMQGGEHYTYTVGIADCNSPEDIVQAIVSAVSGGSTGAVTGTPQDHFTNFEIDGSNSQKLWVYDNRPNQVPHPEMERGLIGAGVTEEKILGPLTDDIQVYNNGFDANGNITYGGVEINHVRHSWEELGFQVSGNTFSQDGSIEFHDYTGERVALHVKAGAELPDVVRNYTWSADDSGIFVNDKFAASWEELGIKEKDNSGEYNFIYHGMNISFTTFEGDSLQDVIDGINGKSLTEKYSWDISIGDYLKSKAVDITQGSEIQVTNDNQNIIDKDYYILADAQGIMVSDNPASGSGNTKMYWTTGRPDFENTNSNLAAAYPISGWGLNDSPNDMTGNDSVSSSTITFDDEATYHYRNEANPDLAIEFDFKLQDETSRDAAISALNGVQFTNIIHAPGDIYADVHTSLTMAANDPNVNASNVTVVKNNLDDNFALQRDYGRDFDLQNDSINGTVTRELEIDYSDTSRNYSEDTGEIDTEPIWHNVPDSSRIVYYDGGDGYYYEYKEEKTTGDILVTRDIDYYKYGTGNYQYSGQFAGEAIVDPASGDNLIPGENSFALLEKTSEHYAKWDSVIKTEYTDTGNRIALSDPRFDALNGPLYSSIVSDIDYSESRANVSMPATPASSVTTLQAENPVTVSDRVEINTASGSPMILSFSTDLNGINKGNEDLNYTSDITFFTSDFATRDFNAVPNTQNNQSEEGIFSEVTINGPRRHLWIQSGADAPDGIDLSWEPMNNSTLGIVGTKVNPREKALKAIAQLDKALDKVLGERTTFGANQNRLEHAYQINLNVVENTDAAESRIRDTDMAAETVRFTKEGMLQQVGQTMLAQANQNRQGILSLLQ